MSTPFKSFDEMLRAAIEDGVLTPKPANAASWQAKSALLNFQFNVWLKAKVQAELGTEADELPDYQQHLTESNFMAFLKEQEKVKQAAVLERKQKVAARWQTKPEIESWPDLFAVPNWQEHLDLLCNTEPPLLVKVAEQYQPAEGVPRGSIAAAFNTFKTYLGRNRLKVEHRMLVANALEKLLPSFQVSGNTVTNKSDHYTKRQHGQEKSLEKQIEAALCRF